MPPRSLVLTVVALIAVALSACSELRSDDSAADEDATPTAVTALSAVRAGGEVRAEGKVVPVHHVTLAFPAGGTVAEVLVSEGEPVEAGDPLIRLDGADRSLAVLGAEASLRAAEAEATKVEALLGVDRQSGAGTLGGATEVAAPAGASAAATVEPGADATANAATLAAARARVDVARTTLEQAMSDLDAMEMVAPFDGVVASIDVAEAEYAAPGAPVLVLADDSEWLVETENLTERDIAGIDHGDRVSITLEAIPELELGGEIVRVRPVGETRLGDVVYTVVVRPDHRDPRLRWNMTADLVIQAETNVSSSG